MRVDPSGPRGACDVPPSPSSTRVVAAETSGVGAAATDVPPPTALDDSDIRHMLDHVLIIQAA